MTNIVMDADVKQELESRGIDETTGVYGDHKVKLGKSPAVRLDSIKSASIPFAGFTKAKKIARGKEGVAKSADNVLKTLTGQADKLDAKKLLGNLKALETHISRLAALGQLTDAQKKEGSWTFTSAVEKLSNSELAAVFQTFSSSEMDLLQTALIREGRINPKARDARKAAEQLFNLQALVLREISNRSINEQITQTSADLSFEGMPGEVKEAVARPESLSQRFGSAEGAGSRVHANDLTAANLVSLAETAAVSANTRERTVQSADADLKARNINNVSVKEIGNCIRNAELTINIKTDFLIGGANPITKHPNDPMVNIFHLHDQGIDPKGEGYLKERDSTEKLLFPELDGHKVNADERPMYGAVNIAGGRIGAVDGNANYGSSAIVLKPHVAKRATYILNDSFVSAKIDTSKERRENFYELLDGINNPENSSKDPEIKIPQSFIDALKDPNSKEHHEFESFLDLLKGDDAVTQGFESLPQIIEDKLFVDVDDIGNAGSDETKSQIHGLFKSFCLKVFGDPQATRSAMATYDNVESLVTQMDTVNSVGLARAALDAKNGESFKAVPDNIQYIEAQIHGPLIPSRDIAEIRLYLDDIPEDECEARIREMEKFGKENGIKITLVDSSTEDADQDDVTKIQRRDKLFIRKHYNQEKINTLKNDYFDNLSAKIQDYIAKNPKIAENLPQGMLRLDGNALAAFFSKFEQEIKKEIETVGPSTEEYIVESAFTKALEPVISLKADLLREVQKMDISEAQKKAVADWVVAAKALRSVDELRVVMNNAVEQSRMLREMANAQPPLTAQEAMTRLTEFTRKIDSELSAMMDETYKGREVGPDDTMTELNRISFMSLSLLKNAEPPLSKEELARMTDIFDGAEMRQMYSQLEGLKAQSRLSTEESVASVDVLLSHIFVNARNLRGEAGERYSIEPRFTGNFRLIQAPVRNVLNQLSPELGQRYAKLYPPYAEFPAPAKPESMPQNAKDRRDFLVKTMDKYVANEAEFESNTATHGRGHIARAYIFADVMCNILEEKGIKVDKNAVMCGISGHDAGREGTGDDHWEDRSANYTVDAMKSSFGDDAMGEEYKQQVKGCIDKSGKTVEAMVMNAADSLDIGRIGVGLFDIDKFPFLKPEGDEEDVKEIEELRKELVKEADLLQRLTNPLCANRQELDRLDMQMIEAPSQLQKSIEDEKDDKLKAISQIFEKDRTVSSEEYMTRFENTVKNNPQLFPVLSKYYSGNAAA